MDDADGPGVPEQTGEATADVDAPTGSYAEFVARYVEEYDASSPPILKPKSASTSPNAPHSPQSSLHHFDRSGIRMRMVLMLNTNT